MTATVAAGVTAIALVGLGLLATWLTVQVCGRRCLHRRRARWWYGMSAREAVAAHLAWQARQAERKRRTASEEEQP